MAPFPYLPMVAILLSLVSYVVVQNSVYSYAGYMVGHLGVVDDKNQAGYYAGLLTSAVMIGRLLSSHFWGVVADRFGCRVVMVVGLVSTLVLSVAFGTSTTFTWAFISRFLLGLLNGIITASKTLVSEVSGKEHEVVGMGVVTTAWSLGTVVGPGIGGILSEPAESYPRTFSKHGIFGRHPYLLPNVVGAGLALLSLPLVFFFLKDTEHTESIFSTFASMRAWWPLGDDEDNDGHDGGKGNGEPARTATPELPQQLRCTTNSSPLPREPTLQIDPETGRSQAVEHIGRDLRDVERSSLLAQQHIRTLLVIDGLYSCVYSGFDEVFTLWSLSTVAKGGLDWSSPQIGQVFLIRGVMVLVFELFAVPNIFPRFGVRLSQRVGSAFEIPVYFLVPLLSVVSGAGLPVTAASAILLFTCTAGSNAFFMGVSLAINDAAGPDRRGELNGISATVGSFSRAISPIICSALFAFSIAGDHPFPLDYHLVFYLLAVVRLAVAYMGWSTINGTRSEEGLDLETAANGRSTLDMYLGRE